jgi:hypothetical protein
MSDVNKTFIAILVAAIGASITAGVNGLIRFPDVAFTLFYIGLAWFAFGAPWEHQTWNHQTRSTRLRRVAPRIYLALTTLTVAIPLVSLAAGSLITKYAPQRIDEDMSKVVMQTPRGIATVTVSRATSSELTKYVAAQRASYVAAGTATDIGICAAEPVLLKVLGQLDSDVRLLPTWVLAIVISLFLFCLWIVEMAPGLGDTQTTP